MDNKSYKGGNQQKVTVIHNEAHNAVVFEISVVLRKFLKLRLLETKEPIAKSVESLKIASIFVEVRGKEDE
jgi:hypothetical protein